MQFDFDKFRSIVSSIYPTDPEETTYTPEQSLAVFYCYFQYYEHHRKQPHPPIKADQILNIIRSMNWMFDEYEEPMELFPEDYPAMIAKHFKTQYRCCDYNINHFFSGKIRTLRYYEVCY